MSPRKTAHRNLRRQQAKRQSFTQILNCAQAPRRQMRAALASVWAVPLADAEARDANAKPAMSAAGDELAVGRITLCRTPLDSSAPQKVSLIVGNCPLCFLCFLLNLH